VVSIESAGEKQVTVKTQATTTRTSGTGDGLQGVVGASPRGKSSMARRALEGWTIISTGTGAVVTAIRRTIQLLLGTIVLYLLTVLLLAAPIFEVGVPRAVVDANVAGSRVVVTQTPNGGLDGHRLRAYVEDGEQWEEFFIEYDAVYSYWGRLRAIGDSVVEIRSNGFLVGVLNVAAGYLEVDGVCPEGRWPESLHHLGWQGRLHMTLVRLNEIGDQRLSDGAFLQAKAKTGRMEWTSSAPALGSKDPVRKKAGLATFSIFS
jgi:hypothetical protein